MTQCGQCGDCCEQILYHTHAALRASFRRTGQHAASAPFVLKHWRPIEKDAYLRRILPPGKRRRARRELRGKSIYDCLMFDPIRRLCMAHDQRPPVCSGFPFYDAEPKRERLGGRFRCSFWFDIPVADWPKEVRPTGFVPLEEVAGV